MVKNYLLKGCIKSCSNLESHEHFLSRAVCNCNFRKIHLQKHFHIDKVTFLRCQEYRSTDFVDGENIL